MKKIIVICYAILILVSASLTVHAESLNNVKVTIPSYNVVLNGLTIDNVHSKYPMLSYKGITYFPMTWDFCQALGLEVIWDEKEGLEINKTSSNGEIKQDLSDVNSFSTQYEANIANYKIIVNGKEANNEEEEYPVLNFRYVTYFPLTWRYSVEEFGWKSDWNELTGLSISSNGDISNQYISSQDEIVEENYRDTVILLKADIDTFKKAIELLGEGQDISDIISELQTLNIELQAGFNSIVPTEKYEEVYKYLNESFTNYNLSLSATNTLIFKYQLNDVDGTKEYIKKYADYLKDSLESMLKSLELFNEIQE